MPSRSIPEFLAALVERARSADGQPSFSDQSLVDLRSGVKQLIAIDENAVAIVSTAEAEFVVDPQFRKRGLGTRLLETIIARSESELRIWAHGDHPAARALAASHGFEPVRTLLQLRMTVPPVTAPRAVDTFRVGTDDAAWLRVNSRAFAFHPEQGSVSQADLDQLESEPWFEPLDFLVERDGDEIAGYCWLKIEDGIGEFYVVGVDPRRQGSGLGRRLMDAGFARLAARGIRTAALYVEADNEPAVHLYRSLGFTDHSVDIQYALR